VASTAVVCLTPVWPVDTDIGKRSHRYLVHRSHRWTLPPSQIAPVLKSAQSLVHLELNPRFLSFLSFCEQAVS